MNNDAFIKNVASRLIEQIRNGLPFGVALRELLRKAFLLPTFTVSKSRITWGAQSTI